MKQQLKDELFFSTNKYLDYNFYLDGNFETSYGGAEDNW